LVAKPNDTAGSVFSHLEKFDVVREVIGKRRDRLFACSDYLAILSEGAEPLE
jgi:hypothetical protein